MITQWPPSADELETEIEALQGKSLKAHYALLRGLGTYLRRTKGSVLSGEILHTIEDLLNDLYLQAEDEGCSEQIVQLVFDAYGKASALSYAIDNSREDWRPEEYFKTAKQLGKMLLALSG